MLQCYIDESESDLKTVLGFCEKLAMKVEQMY